jgi:hypothetical protein
MAIKKVTNDEIPDAKIRNAIWYLKEKKTKKFICEYLGITYNTKKLDSLIEDFKKREAREKELKEKAKTLVITDLIKKDIASRYVNGEAQTAIAASYYLSPQKIKTILMEMNVPIRARAKRGEAKTEHIVQDLDVKFTTRSRVFYGRENCFASILEIYDEEYADRMRLGRQRWIELVEWKERTSRFSEPQPGIHYEIYWELENGESWKLEALKNHVARVENLIAETGRETYKIWLEGDYSYTKIFVPRAELYPVEYK